MRFACDSSHESPPSPPTIVSRSEIQFVEPTSRSSTITTPRSPNRCSFLWSYDLFFDSSFLPTIPTASASSSATAQRSQAFFLNNFILFSPGDEGLCVQHDAPKPPLTTLATTGSVAKPFPAGLSTRRAHTLHFVNCGTHPRSSSTTDIVVIDFRWGSNSVKNRSRRSPRCSNISVHLLVDPAATGTVSTNGVAPSPRSSVEASIGTASERAGIAAADDCCISRLAWQALVSSPQSLHPLPLRSGGLVWHTVSHALQRSFYTLLCTLLAALGKPSTPEPSSWLRTRLAPAARSSSPSARSPSTASPSLGRTRRDNAHFASAASVRALETRFGRLEHSLDSQLTQLFDAIRALQPPTDPAPALLPSQPALQVSLPLPALPPTPRVQPVTSTALTSVGNQNTTAGELPLLSVSRCFPWVPADVVALVERDQLRPEQLVKLRNPESRVSQAAVQSTSLNIEGGQLRISEESAESRTSAFVKAIPSIAALAQVWLVYVAIRARHTNNWELNDALLSHLEQLIEFNQLYTWRAVADYHLAVCRLRFGTGAVIEWSHYDPQIAGRALALPPIPAGSTTLALIARVVHDNTLVFTAKVDTPRAAPNSTNPAARAAHNSTPQVWANPSTFSFACAAHSSTTPARAAHSTPPPPRPNTLCERPIFDATDVPATVGTLQLRYWSQFLDLYPDQAFATQLRGALRHGVKLGYDGPLRHNARPDVNNLPMDSADVQHLRREIETRMQEGRLRHVANPSDVRLVCSPVGVVPKPHSDKRRTIYHLSHPRKPGARLPSVNDGIHPSFVTIRYESLDAIMEFIREHPSASLWKADLEDAFRHVIVSESDARLMGIHFDGRHYQECALAFGGRSSPFLFNLFAEFLHWLTTFALQSVTPSSTSHSEVSHYLDDFFGASDASANPATPVQVLSLASAALGFRISRKKTLWDTTRLEVLGIELDSVAQTASITHQRRQRILQLCGRIVDRGRASLLELQQVAGHLQFVTRVAPHGRAFLRRLYDAVRSHYKAPFGRRISKATRSELLWWIATLNTWDGVSLLQPSPLVVEHVWTDASKRCIGAHLGTMDEPVAAFSHELARRHRRKDIRFLEALAVLEALRRFAPLWSGPRQVVVHVDNENVEYGLPTLSSSVRSPAVQRGQYGSQPPASFVSASGLSSPAAFLLWNGLASSTRTRSTTVCFDFASFAASRRCHPFPSSETLLIEWVAAQHLANKTYGTVKRDLAIIKSWHIDLGLSTVVFDSERLARVVRGLKRVVGAPLPVAKLAITLPLLRQLLRALPTVCPSPHNRRMFRAAFCLAFACFLRSGELTWEAQNTDNMLTVGSVCFASDRSYATITIPASKTDPFRQGVALTAPAVPLSTCAVAALDVVCRSRPSSAPLFILEDGRPFARSCFVDTLRQCLAASGIEPSAYSGHSFRRGAATWAALNGVDDDTIRELGRWRSDCFRRYIDKSAADRAATTKAALYTNASAPLSLDTVAWRDI
ncbi:uncharacterized protein UTRI_10206 [Ustilago trichophora]|uniref:Reverse transcriptase domain-containing protein n=1 Tax=Ustilago trichophora TaxID=86804 RepID=A0A5C3EI58_9BASI|nr:uncharacterized protein UTRI_10206 [Ustilago trichophora]